MMRKFVFILCILFLTSNIYAAVNGQEIEVVRTAYKKDAYRYYITGLEKKASVYDVTLKRRSPTAIKFFKVQVKCAPRAFREMGSSVKSASTIKINNASPWYKPLIGSIEVDVIAYVCR